MQGTAASTNNVIVTITGPSASGKSVLEEMLTGKGCAKIISHTTRAPRAGEENGVNYFFVSKEEFADMERRYNFVETTEFGGNKYGASLAEFNRCFAQGKPVVIVVEPNGRDQIKTAAKDLGWKVLSVYVESPVDITAQRMFDRYINEMEYMGSSFHLIKHQTAFVNRLATALGVEQKWREEARGLNDAYDMLFFLFDETTDRRVVEEIVDAVCYLKDPKKVWAFTQEYDYKRGGMEEGTYGGFIGE